MTAAAETDDASSPAVETSFSRIHPSSTPSRRKRAYGSAVDRDDGETDNVLAPTGLAVPSIFATQEEESELFPTSMEETDNDASITPDDHDEPNIPTETQEDDSEDGEFDVPDDAAPTTGGRTKKTFADAKESGEATDTEESNQIRKSVVEQSKEKKEDEAPDVTSEANDEESDDPSVQSEEANEAVQEEALKKTESREVPPSKSEDAPQEETLFSCVDRFFVQADKDSVTVGDIVRSVESELKVVVTKPVKKKIRNHLTDLITGKIKPMGVTSDDNDEISQDEQEESEIEESEPEDDDNGSDYEEPTTKKAPKPRSRRRKEPQPRRTTRNRKKKPSAAKIHAEMLRKRRMDERMVRNEELQMQQNLKDKERAEKIAMRFETNTEELRLQRLEDRLDLLQKLDQKRIQVIADEERVEKEDEAIKPQETVPGVESTENSGSEESSDEEMELEIVGGSKSFALNPETRVTVNKTAIKSNALSLLDRTYPIKPKKHQGPHLDPSKPQSSPGKSLGARAALRNALLAKQRKAGNLWLARELGYKTEEEHLKDCLKAEEQKRQRVVKVEKERLLANERKQLRERLLLQGEDEELFEEEEHQEDGKQDEEEDEEMALAKAIEGEKQEENQVEEENQIESALPMDTGDSQPPATDSVENNSTKTEVDNENARREQEESDGDETVAFETPAPDMLAEHEDDDPLAPESEHRLADVEKPTVETNSAKMENSTANGAPAACAESSSVKEETTTVQYTADGGSVEPIKTQDAVVPTKDLVSENSTEQSDVEENEFQEEEAKESDEEHPKEKKPRNAAWQAMLQKEAQKLKQLKKRKGGLVEEEADEEEEEEGVAGLEDFGFSLHKKKKEEEEDDTGNDKVNEDDLENIVDDLSDNEGDEEAGDAARKVLEQKEERERHKEILRRMREGYDGRRGGIAGAGVGARGIHRFDQLVAADNRDDAKRLGLLNDDEIDSDNEEGKDGDEKDQGGIEDETALLDKMLKDRFLHRSSVDQELEENFSDDEDGEDGAVVEDGEATKDDEEEKEQERLAKRFAKRARMQRLLEKHRDDKEFSQLRLIDEDESMKLDLMKMKTVSSRNMRQSSMGSSRSSSMGGSDSNVGDSSDSGVKQHTRGLPGFGGLLSNGGKLSVALQASRRTKPRTSFLGGNGNVGREAASIHKSVALSHVVFHTGESQLARSNMSFSSRTKSVTAGKRKRTSFQASTSLWSKVSANGFKKKERR